MKDPQIKEFIEKCIVSASERLSAEELLKDSFLQVECPKNPVCDSLKLPGQTSKAIYTPNSAPLSMDIDVEYKQVSGSTNTGSNNRSLDSPILEFQRVNKNNEFRLKGAKNDDTSVSLTLRIADPYGEYMLFSFSFVFHL